MAKLPTDIPELVKQFGPTLHTVFLPAAGCTPDRRRQNW